MAYAVFYPVFVDAMDLDILQMLSYGKTKQQVSEYFCNQTDRTSLSELQVDRRLELLKEMFCCRTDNELIAFCIRKHIII